MGDSNTQLIGPQSVTLCHHSNCIISYPCYQTGIWQDVLEMLSGRVRYLLTQCKQRPCTILITRITAPPPSNNL